MWKRIVAYGTAAIMGIVCAVGFFGVFMITTVTGSGMEPFYKEGHCVLVCKAAYRKSIPEVGEVVALWNQVYSEDGEGSVLIRRIAAGRGIRSRSVTMCLSKWKAVYGVYERRWRNGGFDASDFGRRRIIPAVR